MKRTDNIFNSVQSPIVERNTFDLSHSKKLTFQMGELVPTACIEALPGDSFKIDFVNMFRMAPMLAPIMHRVKLRTDYFFVPNRILWSAWEDFITGASTNQAPYIRVGIDMENAIDIGTIADYLGVPTGSYVGCEVELNALPFAAYMKIYDDWYRAATIIPEKLLVPLVSGNNTANWFDIANGQPLRAAWEHDYFTSALLTTQQGDQVDLPLTFADNIEVMLKDVPFNPGVFVDEDGDPGVVGNISMQNGPVPFARTIRDSATTPMTYDPQGSLVVDVNSEAVKINDLREAFAFQSFLERTLRGGVRYAEQTWSHFRVKSSDARLQRPEFIGRSVQTVSFSEVLATAQDTTVGDEVAVGEMFGHGITTGGGKSLTYHCEEHGFIIGLLSMVPDTGYMQGLAPMWFNRNDRYSYAWPSFAHLGERPVPLRELVAANNNGDFDPNETFGYLPQYAEYKYHPSMVAGEFRDTLDFWHLDRKFDTSVAPPALNEDFISCRPDTRIFAVTDENQDHVWGWIMNQIHVSRMLPRFGTPQLIG